MKYIKVEWPDIQEYMTREDYQEGVYYDSQKGCWFIPEEWEKNYE